MHGTKSSLFSLSGEPRYKYISRGPLIELTHAIFVSVSISPPAAQFLNEA